MCVYSCVNTLTGSMRILCRLCGVSIYMCTDMCIYTHVLIRVSTYMCSVHIHVYGRVCLIYIHTLTHVSTYTCVYSCVNTLTTSIWICNHMWRVYMYMCTDMCICTNVLIRVSTNTCVYFLCINKYMSIFTWMDTYINACIWTLPWLVCVHMYVWGGYD